MERARDLRAPKRLDNIYFEIVQGCQLACLGCPVSGLQPKVERIPLERLERCLGNIDIDEVEVLALYGYGEPLLHDDLPGLFRVVERQRWTAAHVEISTNAQDVDWDQLEEVLRTRRLTELIVSCDGDGTPELYEALRPPSRWSRLLEFLERARDLRDRYCPSLQLRTRTSVPNWNDRFGWEDVLRPRGWIPEYRHYAPLIGATHNMTGRPAQPVEGSCVFVEKMTSLMVNIDGTVVPCCVHPRAGVYGNLQERLFSEIHTGPARAAFRQQLRERRSAMEICGQCEWDETMENAATRAVFYPEEAFQEGLVPIQRLTVRDRRLVTVSDS